MYKKVYFNLVEILVENYLKFFENINKLLF